MTIDHRWQWSRVAVAMRHFFTSLSCTLTQGTRPRLESSSGRDSLEHGRSFIMKSWLAVNDVRMEVICDSTSMGRNGLQTVGETSAP